MSENLRRPNAGFPTPEEWMRDFVPPGCTLPGPGAVSAWVAGVPAPQGSKRALPGRGGFRPVLVESSTKVRSWRLQVWSAFVDTLNAMRPGLGHRDMAQDRTTPVIVKIVFVMPRTKAMRNRPSADFPMVQKPDTDKLARAVLDALTSAGVYADDSQVVALHGFKRRAEPGEPTGAMIHVEPWQVEPGPPEPVPHGLRCTCGVEAP